MPVQASTQRTYNISMVAQKIVYNEAGDNDPQGIAYVLDNQLDKAGRPKAGTDLKPLFIRANEGDCLNLVLTNRLPQAGVPLGAGDPLNPVENVAGAGTATVTNLDGGKLQTVVPSWPAGNRASLHPSGLIRYYRHQRRRRRDRLQLRHHRRAGRVLHLQVLRRLAQHRHREPRRLRQPARQPAPRRLGRPGRRAQGRDVPRPPHPGPAARGRAGGHQVRRRRRGRALLPRVRGRRAGRPEPDGQGRQADRGRGGRRPGGWCPRPGRPRAARPQAPRNRPTRAVPPRAPSATPRTRARWG